MSRFAGVTLIFVALLCLAPPPAHAQAAGTTYTITVALDDITKGDLQVLQDSLAAAPEGQEVTKSLRRLMAAASQEISILVNKRIDHTGTLTLDDGSLVQLAEGDRIDVMRQCEAKYCPGATLVWDTPDGGGRPFAVYVVSGSGCIRQIVIGAGGPPVIIGCYDPL